MQYKMSKQRGQLNEVDPAAPSPGRAAVASLAAPAPQQASARSEADLTVYAERRPSRPPAPTRAAAVARPIRRGWLWSTIEDGQRALVRTPDGRSEVVVGPRRLWRWGRQIIPLERWVAHPGDFLIVRARDGGQQHLAGPTDRWLDPRVDASIEVEEALRLDAKEAIVVYARDGDAVQRRIVRGPAAFVPEPGEWLHTFAWHGSRFVDGRYVKVPGALEFQKLWQMPDQMYHDVPDVRTADDALLTIRLMVFFELVDIERMLDATHDPIGDFVNAATSDVIDWVGRHDFDSFKKHTGQLNDVEAYPQLAARAKECGYALHKVVYRGYGATAALQRMHDEAIESRTRLMLERATEQQAQELEDAKLEREHARAARRRDDDAAAVSHRIDVAAREERAELERLAARAEHLRTQEALAAAAADQALAARQAREQAHLTRLAELGVDLTALLTRGAPDRVIEVRGGGTGGHHVHVDAGER